MMKQKHCLVDTRYAKDYDGWNIPGVHHWIPCPSLDGENEETYDAKSPFTGGNVKLESREEEVTFRGEKVKVNRKYYRCLDTGKEFTDNKLDDDLMWDAVRAYCEKKGIGFKDLLPDESDNDIENAVDRYLVENYTDDPEVKIPFLERTFSNGREDLIQFAKYILNWKKENKEIVSDSLTAEIKRYIEKVVPVYSVNAYGVYEKAIKVEDYETIATHFAEWGKDNLFNVNDDLDKASIWYSTHVEPEYPSQIDPEGNEHEMFDRSDLEDAFEAGANWQEKKDEIEIDKAYKCADNVQYERGYAKGYNSYRENHCKGCFDRDEIYWKGEKHAIKMLKKGGIDGVIETDGDDKAIWHKSKNGMQYSSFPKLYKFSEGDKVKIIILKADDDETEEDLQGYSEPLS